MNILHVLSQFEVTGAETYAAALIQQQVRQRHSAFIVSDTLSKKVPAEYIPLTIGQRDLSNRLRNMRMLREIIRSRNIHVVHAHSRAASWVAYFATRKSEVPLISTVHGRQHVHLSSKLFNIYGEKIIAICEGIKEQLVRDLGIAERRIVVIRNGLNLEEFRPKCDVVALKRKLKIPRSHRVISLIGRLSGPKGDVAKLFVSEIVSLIRANIRNVTFLIVGGMGIPNEFVELVGKVDQIYRDNVVRLLGYQENVTDYFEASDVVVGSGRVVAEALALGKPVVGLGESNYVGVIDEQCLNDALRTNFGDAGEKQEIDPERIANDIVSVLRGGKKSKHVRTWGQKIVEEEFDIRLIAQQIERVYAGARMIKKKIKEIPVLMYHRVTDSRPAQTKHGIYITTADFERQLRFLKRRNYHTITFSDLVSFKRGERELPRKPVILTFDDGYREIYLSALPLMKQFGMKGVIFIVGNPKIRRNVWDIHNGEPKVELMKDKEILEMNANGFEFGAHSMNHRSLPELKPEQAFREIADCKRSLEKRLHMGILAFAYPYGALNETVKKLVQTARFEFGVATDSGPIFFADDWFEIRRIPIFPDTSLFGFWKKTSGWYHRYRKLFGKI